MKYRLTCLTPLLVGDGGKLSVIDYMVWKDQVNVLNQRRIFKLLSKGPRLDGYLAQLKKATKLDFASWGGFAQNFAGRRIPFENSAYSAYWERATGETLNIPTFAAGASGPYVPGTAIKGALRTGMIFAHSRDDSLRDVAARSQGDRPVRHPSEGPEDHALGLGGSSRARFLSAGDSAPVAQDCFKIYLLRVATLQQKAPGAYSLGWKQSPRGTVDGRRPEDSTPIFAEMASPGSVFQGSWEEKVFLDQPEIRRALRWQSPVDRRQIFEAVNHYAAKLLGLHKQYAVWTNLTGLAQRMDDLEARLASAQQSDACLLPLGWGGGLLGKTAWLNTADKDHRQILQTLPLYKNALDSGLPFPKTRRIVFLDNQPATLPGWTLLEIE